MAGRYERGDTIPLSVETRDNDDVLFDPTSIKVTITDPTGVVKVTEQDMTRDGTGLYSYQYSTLITSELGIWSVRYKAVSASFGTELQDDQFELIVGVPVSLPTYCNPDDISSLLQVPRFTVDTTPTRDDVVRQIVRKESYIDSRTSQSWRLNTATDEYHEYKMSGIKLLHVPVRAVSQLQLYTGSGWQTKTEGRESDFIVDEQFGIIYFVMWFWHPTRYIRYGMPRMFGKYHNSVRVSYTWGKVYGTDEDSGVVNELATKLVAIDLFTSSDYSDWIRQGTNMVDLSVKIDIWSRATDDELRRLTRLRSR